MDPFETFVLRERASSIVECDLINRDQKAQIFHPASIRIWKKSIWQKKSAGIHKILWSWLFHSMQATCQTLQLSLQLRPNMGRQIFVQHFPFHGEQNLLIKQRNPEQTRFNETNKPCVRSSIICRFHSTSNCAHFQFSIILWLRTV